MDLIRGRHIIPSNTEEFLRICKSLDKAFTGAMRLLGEINGDIYQADLLIKEGKIIAASLDDLNKGTTILKEDALSEIRSKMIGVRGRLDVYEFDEEDMNETIANNTDAILSPESIVPLSSLGVRLVPIEKKESEQKKRDFIFHFGFGKSRSPESKYELERKIDLDTLERRESRSISSIVPGLERMSSEEMTEISRRKMERLEELKRRHMLAKKKIMAQREHISIREGEKIQTPIDRFFSLVKKYKRIRIDDNLAKKLGVSKTQIEEWAMILEEHKLVELHYPAIGEPEIRIVEGNE
ncbi:MAG: hypothetical protein DRO95_01555 [Candidatus Altiarchaeales archaeon]|nr:MAG: hypothetical protein DRO95_01555 [Candidatus Altiarchaeales archaeon]